MKIIKIIKSQPQMQKLLAHDAPVLRIMNMALVAFIIISSITVFFGVQSHISEYLAPLPWLVAFPAYAVAYLIFSLVPDLLNSIFAAHVVRSFLIKKFKDVLSIILICTLLIVVIFLSSYSWKMSRSSALSISNNFAPDVKLDDVAKFDSLATLERATARNEYERDLEELEQRFDVMLAAELLPLENRALPYRTKITQLESGRSENNTSWTTSQIEKTRKKLLPIEDKIAAVKSDIQKKKSAEIFRLKKLHKDNTQQLNNRLFENRQDAIKRNGKKESKVETVTASFSGEFKKIAGFAVIIVLILTSLLEILYHRNGIERKPVIQEWNFQLSGLFEVLYLPFSFVGRHTLNRVRSAYQKLPELLPAPDFKKRSRVATSDYSTVQHPATPPVAGYSTVQQAAINPSNTGVAAATGCSSYDLMFDDSVAESVADCEKDVVDKTTDQNTTNVNHLSTHADHPKNGNHTPHAKHGSDISEDLIKMISKLSSEVKHISDQIFTTCEHSDCEEKFIKKKKDHRFCCSDHQEEYWQIKNGKKLKFKK